MAIVRRALLARDQVLDDVAAAREALLEQRLEVVRRLERLLDLPCERADDGRGAAVVAEAEVDRADHRLADGGQDAVAADQLLGAAPALLGRGSEHVGQPEVAGDLGARLAADRLRAQLRQAPRAGGLEARVELG